jgi:type IV pilus assembly protein PilB
VCRSLPTHAGSEIPFRIFLRSNIGAAKVRAGVCMHRFRDEWIVPLVREMGGVSPRTIEEIRAAGPPYVAAALVARKVLARTDLTRIVESRYRIPAVDLAAALVEPGAFKVVPERVCREKCLLPFQLEGRAVYVAMANPLDGEAEQVLQVTTGRRVVPRYCLSDRVEQILGQLLDPAQVIYDLLRQVEVRQPVELLGRDPAGGGADSTEMHAPVIRLVNALIAQAVAIGASDIHLEHDERASVVRYRVDGELRPGMTLPRYIGAGPAVARIKIMAMLDIAERRRPQDGRAKLRVGADEIGLRVSTLPTRFGEKVVIRLLNARSALRSTRDLGFSPEVRRRLEEPFSAAQGLILVTGPTGSGKTTSLYAVIARLATGRQNVVSVEDPIEYQLEGITQVQVNEAQGLTFPVVLRSILRQDPDTILVGEIRDTETAEVACQAAMTGHLVLSTLHTNDTTSTIVRLADMGIDRFKIAASLIAVTAQRLARGLCGCAKPVPPAEMPERLRKALERHQLPVTARRPSGCAHCGGTGQKGRVPVGEVLQVTRSLQETISAGGSAADLRRAALAGDWLHTLEADALWQCSEGRISADEAMRYLESTSVTPAAASDALRVLVADGSARRRQRLSSVLEAAGFAVDGVAELAVAVEHIASNPPAALILGMDPGSPGGVAGIAYLRSRTGLLDLPIVAICGDEESRAEMLAAGASDALSVEAIEDSAVPIVRGALTRRGDFAPLEAISTARIPADEAARLASLHRTKLLDSPPEERFDRITRLAQSIFGVPIALVTLVDRGRQWFKSNQGLEGTETPREDAFCAHAILARETMIVPDAALDPRFAFNPLVTGGPGIRFYAGHPVVAPDGQPLGTLCVIDHVPRQFSEADADKLRGLAALVEQQIADVGVQER